MATNRTSLQPSLIRYTRYVARALGTALLAFMLIFALGYFIQDVMLGEESLTELGLMDTVGFLMHGMTLLGLVIAWRREGVGALLILAPFVLRIIAGLSAGDGIPGGGFFLPFVLVGILYGLVWFGERQILSAGDGPAK